MNERPRQYLGFIIDTHQLERALDIPRDHHIIRVDLSSNHQVPGVHIVVEGPGGWVTPDGCAVSYENLGRWLAEVDQIREQSLAEYGPYEW